jgi:signal transduction histidine kinase
VRVSDTGVGIPRDALPRVFDRFYRADTARQQSGGTGLGLAIARMIAEQHGGTIAARSEPGRGSTFTVRLPAR